MAALLGGLRPLGCAFVDTAVCDRCQQLIGVLLLGQRLLKKFDRFMANIRAA